MPLVNDLRACQDLTSPTMTLMAEAGFNTLVGPHNSESIGANFQVAFILTKHHI